MLYLTKAYNTEPEERTYASLLEHIKWFCSLPTAWYITWMEWNGKPILGRMAKESNDVAAHYNHKPRITRATTTTPTVNIALFFCLRDPMNFPYHNRTSQNEFSGMSRKSKSHSLSFIRFIRIGRMAWLNPRYLCWPPAPGKNNKSIIGKMGSTKITLFRIQLKWNWEFIEWWMWA